VSSANLKNFLNKVAIPHFAKRAGSKGQRANIEERPGQIFIIEENTFKKEFIKAGLTVGITYKALEANWERALQAAVKVFNTMDLKGVPKARQKQIKEELKDPKFKAKVIGTIGMIAKVHYFIVKDYQAALDQKKPGGRFNKALTQIYKELGADAELAQYTIGGDASGQGKKGLTDGTQKSVTGFNLGHGEYGRAVAGLTAKEIKEKTQRTKTLSAEDKDKVYNVFAEVDEQLKISIDHEFVFTKSGKLRKDYILVLSLQSAAENLADAQKERTAFEKLEKDLKKLITDPTSTKLTDAIKMSIMHSLSRSKYTTTKTKTKERFNERSRANDKKKIKRQTGVRVARMGSVMSMQQAKKIGKPKRATQNKQDKRSLLSYINEINKRLPAKIEENMGPPALESRTGRFASSVRAVDVNKTAQGYPSIGYTYAKNPYQIFEQGRGQKPWASPERDPRILIDKSLREIAVELALGRFYTRRL